MDLMLMLGSNDKMDLLGEANSVSWYGNTLRRVLEFEIPGQMHCGDGECLPATCFCHHRKVQHIASTSRLHLGVLQRRDPTCVQEGRK